MAFRLKLQESLSCPIGALLLGVGAGNGVQRICPVPVLFISLLYSGLFRGRAQRQRLGLETPSHLPSSECNVGCGER